MKILDKSMNIALQLHQNRVQQDFHIYSFLYRKTSLIAIGKNNMIVQKNKALSLGKKFNVKHFLDFPYIHAEMDALSKNRLSITGKEELVVIRLNTLFSIKLAKPCIHCEKVIKAIGIRTIHYTTNESWISTKYTDY